MCNQPPYQVFLIGGASGVGKTSVSYRLARQFGVGITEIDDFQAILERMTTPDQYPVLHLFRTRPDEWGRLDEEERLAVAISYAEVMASALEPVIANHLANGPSIVLEGDFLVPSLAVRPAYDDVPALGRVRAVILYEDEEQIGRNYLVREQQPQPERARNSWRYSEWLRQEAERLGIATISARPWETVLARARAALLPVDDPNSLPATARS
jgi:2-phosphoglycerate kinase